MKLEDDDAPLMVEADFEIIKTLTEKNNLLSINMNKLIQINDIFIQDIKNINASIKSDNTMCDEKTNHRTDELKQ